MAAPPKADGIELDVHMLTDGSLVVFHDSSLERCTNGRGSIFHLKGDEIKQFDAGEKFAAEFKGEGIPLLSDVLELIANTPVLLNLEIKNDFGFITNIGDAVTAMLDKYDMAVNVYTVDDLSDIMWVIDLGVDSVITNDVITAIRMNTP